MDVQRNTPGGSSNLRPTGPTQGPTRSGGERGRPEQAGEDGADRTATPADRQARLAALRQRNARRAQQDSSGTQSQGRDNQGVQDSGTQEEQGLTRSQRARITAIRTRRARLANAENAQNTEQTPASPAGDQVDLSSGGLTVDQARNRIARLQNFIANQLGQGPEATESTDEAVPPPAPEPPAETPVELPPAQEEGLSIEQMLQRIARLVNAFENGFVPGQQQPSSDTPPAGPEAAPTPDTLERAPGTPTVASPILQAPINVTLPAFQPTNDLGVNLAAETFSRAGDSLNVSSDSLVLSAGAAALSNAAEQLQSQARPPATPERLNELRAAFEAGTLNTAELVERAADSLLSTEIERSRS